MGTLFGTDGVRGMANQPPMTVEIALQLGRALSYLLKKHDPKKHHKVLIGKDTRLSGYMIEQALSAGICSMGVDVLLVGPIPTPAVAFLTRAMRADAGMVISASHNPFQDNGIKFFDRNGFKLPDLDEKEMEELIFSNELDYHRPTAKNVGKAYRLEDARGRYIEFSKSTFPKGKTLDGLRIAVDCANGAAYKIAPRVFEELGAAVTSLATYPNGTNINDKCGSTFMDPLCAKVRSGSYDCGIAFDGDADRVLFVDGNGEIVNGDQIMAICAKEMQAQGLLRSNTLVATIMSNLGFEHSLKKLGIDILRTQVGDRYVLEEMLKHDLNLGGEQSGHVIFLDHNTSGDGLITSLKILAVMIQTGRPLAELAAFVETYPQVLINVKVRKRKQIIDVPELMQRIADIEKELGRKGRVLVRHSGTEPKVRVMLEGENDALIQRHAEDLANLVKRTLG
ncbi:MAG: phosphoglucosamine mutase [Deltaproteobacteria bacterium RIFOXYA12_FULL_61_11]|nr:MAG: phosphoglucosamine mutase [Deltaproteobacteria bacterium RIFOXYA12_FULL_61_11]